MVHVHIGGFIPNKEFTIYSFVLGHLLQDDLFAMLPDSRRKGEYSQPLDTGAATYLRVLELVKRVSSEPKIGYQATMNEAYEEVFKWLSRGIEPGDGCNKTTPHPQGRYCGGHSSPRYKWLNLVCTNFSRARLDEGNKEPSWTIEFRNHSGTLSYRKIEHWVLICMSFVWFVENRQGFIVDVVCGKRSISLNDIIKEAYPKSHPTLLKYVAERTHLFSGAKSSKDSKDADIEVEGTTIEFLTENFKSKETKTKYTRATGPGVDPLVEESELPF